MKQILAATAIATSLIAPEVQANEIREISEDGLHCLQQNVYWEARNQSTLGRAAVAWLTINRMESSKYPNSICAVVKQGKKDEDGNMVRHQCQFSWYCDGLSDKIPQNDVIEQKAWTDAGIIAATVAASWEYKQDELNPIGESTMYHADYTTPYWVSAYEPVVQIDDHIFYE